MPKPPPPPPAIQCARGAIKNSVLLLGWVLGLLMVQSCAIPAGEGASQPLSPLLLPPTALNVRETQMLAATCLTCHGRAGLTAATALVDIAPLHGRSASDLLQRLRAFEGERSATATVMPQIVRALNEAQLQALAQWFAQQETIP